MGLFSRNAKALVPVTPRLIPRRDDDDRFDGAELNDAVSRAIDAAMKKSLSYANYIAFDNLDDQSGYFGTEFEIRTTAGRLKGLYSREPWIYTSATHIAKALSSVPMKLYNPANDQEIKKHFVIDILKSGSPTQSNIELQMVEGVDLLLGGNYFLLLEPDLKTVAGLAPVDMVSLVYSQDMTRIAAIDVFSMGVGTKAARFPMEQVVHVKLPNPSNFMYGMSPFAAAARPILQDRYKNEYEMAFYLRGATSQGVIETTEDLSKSRFQRLMRTFEQAFTGRANWWRTIFLPKGAKWSANSLTMAEMQHLETLKENRKTILAVLGIPPSIVGLIEDVNRATAEQQERIFWMNTIVPLCQLRAAGWNNSHLIKNVLKGKVEVRPDFSGIDAVEGFAALKKEKAEAMAPYFTIDEIRRDVWKAQPIGDERGLKLVAEIKSAAAPGFPGAGQLALPPAAAKAAIPDGYTCMALMFPKDTYPTREMAIKWAGNKGYKSDSVEECSDHWRMQQNLPDAYDQASIKEIALDDGVRGLFGKPADMKAVRAAAKAAATASQNRIETRLGVQLLETFRAYVDDLLSEARKALLEKRHVRTYLEAYRADRAKAWAKRALPTLLAAQDRGFSAGLSQVKAAFGETKRDSLFPGLNETDKQAVDVLKERTRDGRRRTLEERSIERFDGLDATQTENVMRTIQRGEEQGQSYEEIARTIRDTYGEAYDGQANTIVRTEILSAVSEGLDWNHQVLRQVFTQVLKEWMHQGDDAINSHARQEHVELDGVQVENDDVWTYTELATGNEINLAYPRDPQGGPGAVINCRCTMVSVIPDDASSNAEAILNS